MDEIIKQKQAVEKSYLSRMGTAILDNGKVLGVNWLPMGDDLGYTSETPLEVNVAWEHAIYEGLTPDEVTTMHVGVFAHELLHQCLTDFRETNKICAEMSRAEAAIFMQFANTLEDPAIEFFAPQIFGGVLLDALHFSIRHIYMKSVGIGKETHPFSQLINALISFGDMGIVKGKFTFPEAEETFREIAPLYNRGIEEPDAKKRLRIALECMKKAKPLWEDFAKKQELMEELLKKLAELMKRKSKPTKSPEKGTETEKSKRRKAAEESGKYTEGEKSGKSEASDEKTGENPTDGEKTSGGEESSDGEETPSDGGTPSDSGALSDEAKAAAKAVASVTEAMSREAESSAKAEKAKKGDEIPDFSIHSELFKSATCKNVQAPKGRDSEYKAIKQSYAWEIKGLTKTLEKIFEAENDAPYRATSGTYNIKRGSIGTSARIFDKRRDKADKKDAAVVLCIDLSGSMRADGKIEAARKAAIVFAESLATLKIPCYIMGFSADGGADADHTHFVRWNDSASARTSLAGMRAGGNNFDGYSIRYAAELLKGTTATHKIMFVISDGQPACCKYASIKKGIEDTACAIKESRKFGDVFGISIGNCGPEVLQGMYGRDYIHCPNPELLTQTLIKQLGKVFKR